MAVILIHTTTRTLEASAFNVAGYSWTLFLNQISRFAVPLFFLISGMVLEISFHQNGYWPYLKKRFTKIFFPYIFWSLVYYYFVYSQNDDSLLKVFLTGNASYQLYFIPTLFIYYLIFPFLHKAYNIISNKYFLAMIFLLQIFFQSYDYYIKYIELSDPIRIALMSYSLFIIGIIAARNIDKINMFIKKRKTVLFLLSGTFGFLVFWEGRSRYLSTGNYLSYYSQWRPSVLIYTILVGLVLYYIFEYLVKENLYISRFSKHSFFVFFVHVGILEFLWTHIGSKVFTLLNGNVLGSWFFDPIFFIILSATSFVIARFVHRIPALHKFVG